MTSKWLITGHNMSPNAVSNIAHTHNTRRLRRERQINVLSIIIQQYIIKRLLIYIMQQYNLSHALVMWLDYQIYQGIDGATLYDDMRRYLRFKFVHIINVEDTNPRQLEGKSVYRTGKWAGKPFPDYWNSVWYHTTISYKATASIWGLEYIKHISRSYIALLRYVIIK